MTFPRKQLVLELLAAGYAQKTIARKSGMSVKDISKLGRENNVGRRPGMTRKQVQDLTPRQPRTIEQAFSAFFASV